MVCAAEGDRTMNRLGSTWLAFDRTIGKKLKGGEPGKCRNGAKSEKAGFSRTQILQGCGTLPSRGQMDASATRTLFTANGGRCRVGIFLFGASMRPQQQPYCSVSLAISHGQTCNRWCWGSAGPPMWVENKRHNAVSAPNPSNPSRPGQQPHELLHAAELCLWPCILSLGRIPNHLCHLLSSFEAVLR